jgi:mitochondrial fission protein ELM1
LGFPFEAKKLKFNQRRRLPLLRNGLGAVDKGSRALIRPPWPDLVMAVGYASVPVARHIREQTARAKLIHVGNPREKLKDFDLQITTPQYTRGTAPNLLELAFPIGNPASTAKPTADEIAWLDDFPRPRRLIAVGGPARHWQLDHEALRRAIGTIKNKRPTGSLIAATSNRTTRSTRNLLDAILVGDREAVVDKHPAFATLLAESDEIYVTADSVSMLAEAILSGKPAAMIPIKRSLRGRLSHWLWEVPTGRRTLPNFVNFWDLLRRRELIGTVELPVPPTVSDTVERAADAVRSVLQSGDEVDQARH